MEERQVTIDGDAYQLPPLFTVLATENPIEYEGTYPLPEAQLDRFQLKILLTYPSEAEEREVLARWDAGFNSKRLDQVDIRPLPDPDAILRCRAEVARARMEPGVQHYAVDLVRRTRIHPFIHYGASPRASVALLLCSKALAAIRERDFVTPDDVRDVALPVLRHRLSLRAEAELDGPGGTPEGARLGRLAAYVRDKRIPLEMCPTSNVMTGAAKSIEEHPIGLLRRLSFRVTINTDNRLMSGTSMTKEFSQLAEAFGYGLPDFQWFTLNAMKSAFIPFDERLAMINDVIKPGYRELMADQAG